MRAMNCTHGCRRTPRRRTGDGGGSLATAGAIHARDASGSARVGSCEPCGARVAPYEPGFECGTLGAERFHHASFTNGHVDRCGTTELRAAPLGARRKPASRPALPRCFASATHTVYSPYSVWGVTALGTLLSCARSRAGGTSQNPLGNPTVPSRFTGDRSRSTSETVTKKVTTPTFVFRQPPSMAAASALSSSAPFFYEFYDSFSRCATVV